jgi:hypothetical protein
MSTNDNQARLGALALVLAGLMFLLYPGTRPWHDETTAAGASEAMTSTAWLASHSFAMVGFVLVPLGLLALRRSLLPAGVSRLALTGAVLTWLGAGLVLPYYGAETFGLYAVAHAAADREVTDVLAVTDAVRWEPLAVTMFTVGLLALGLGAVLVAVAGWGSGRLPRTPAVLFAAGYALFLPQFFTPPAARIAHGVLLAAGLVWLGVVLWRSDGVRHHSDDAVRTQNT